MSISFVYEGVPIEKLTPEKRKEALAYIAQELKAPMTNEWGYTRQLKQAQQQLEELSKGVKA